MDPSAAIKHLYLGADYSEDEELDAIRDIGDCKFVSPSSEDTTRLQRSSLLKGKWLPDVKAEWSGGLGL